MPVIMMSGHATIDTAVEATKIGALAFLEKPITLQKLLKAVDQGLARGSLRKATALEVQSVSVTSVEYVESAIPDSARGGVVWPPSQPEFCIGQTIARSPRRV